MSYRGPMAEDPEDPARTYPLHDPARLGYRFETRPDGELAWIPLTPADLLDPWPGWEACQDSCHSRMLHTLSGMLRSHFEDQDALVLCLMKMMWHIPGLPEPAPDIAIIQGIREVDPDQWYFDIVETGLLPSLVIEIATMLDPEVRRQDYEEKKDIYERVGIPEYLVIAPACYLTEDKLLLNGYRLGINGRYSPIEPDSHGRLQFKEVGLEFGVAEDGRTLEVFTPTRRLLSARELYAEVARLRAENEKLKRGLEGK